ncbi:hypothetical protein [Marinobacter goseongensis]|uniref:hypothetical protein n=1 Tax=Marinobacter goseongensis TaxID=453838 RepID=UPI0020066952|nr:hypothetical protein [Marinobacter goseongensis]MCK7553393.1 hypothetical protein [Marinobacter goseongensis]
MGWAVTQIYLQAHDRERYGVALTFDRLCPDHRKFTKSTCLNVDDTTEAKIAFAKRFVKSLPGGFDNREVTSRHVQYYTNGIGKLPITLSVAEFFNHQQVRNAFNLPYIRDLKDSDFHQGNPNRDPRTYNIRQYFDKVLLLKAKLGLGDGFVSALENELGHLPDGVNTILLSRAITEKSPLSKEAFFNLPSIKALHGQGGMISRAMASNLMNTDDHDAFFSQVMLPEAQTRAERIVGALPKLENGAISKLIGTKYLPLAKRKEAENQALRAVYVPAIALSISLLFVLLNVLNIIKRLVYLSMLCIYRFTHQQYTRSVKYITGAGLIVIACLPVMLTPNSFVHSQLTDRALEEVNLAYLTCAYSGERDRSFRGS